MGTKEAGVEEDYGLWLGALRFGQGLPCMHLTLLLAA